MPYNLVIHLLLNLRAPTGRSLLSMFNKVRVKHNHLQPCSGRGATLHCQTCACSRAIRCRNGGYQQQRRDARHQLDTCSYCTPGYGQLGHRPAAPASGRQDSLWFCCHLSVFGRTIILIIILIFIFAEVGYALTSLNYLVTRAGADIPASMFYGAPEGQAGISLQTVVRRCHSVCCLGFDCSISSMSELVETVRHIAYSTSSEWLRLAA